MKVKSNLIFQKGKEFIKFCPSSQKISSDVQGLNLFHNIYWNYLCNKKKTKVMVLERLLNLKCAEE